MVAAARSRWAQMPRRYAQASDVEAVAPANAINRTFAVAGFALLLLFIIALNPIKIGGFPVRGVIAPGMLVIAVLLYTNLAKVVWKKNQLLLGLALAMGILGTFVSVVNGASGSEIAKSLTEVYVQAVITILVAGILARICGPRWASWAIVGVIGLSAFVAALQMLDVHAAWSFRSSLGPLQDEETEGLNFVARRPPGLSFSPIQLSTQLCLAFAAFAAVRDRLRRNEGIVGPDIWVIVALGVFFAACFASETRSPILGGLIFLVIYAVQRRASWFALLLIAGGILLYFAWPLIMEIIQGHAPRVIRTDDNSAAVRQTMAYYGIRLFLDNPLGYGFAFDPTTMWTKYWPDLYMMPAPDGVQIHPLHNYVTSMPNIYGIGLLLMVPIVFKLLRRGATSLIFFIPYAVQIMFHNSGPFYSDSVIWFVVGAIGAASAAGVVPVEKLNRVPRLRPRGPGIAPVDDLVPARFAKRKFAGSRMLVRRSGSR